MSILQRLQRNLSFKFLTEGISRVFSLLFFIILSRYLSDSGYGQYAFALAYAALFTTMLLDLGINTWIIRELAQRRDQAPELYPNLLVIRLVASLVVFALVPLSLWALNYQNTQIFQVCLGTLIMVAMGWIDTLSACFNGLETIQMELRMKSLQRILSTSASLGILCLFPQVEAVLWTVGICYLLAAAYGLYMLFHQLGPPKPRALEASLQLDMLKQSLPFFMTGVFFLIYTRVDVVMLSLYSRPDAEIGWYQAAVKIIDVINLFPLLMVLALYPILSEYALKNPEKLPKMGNRGLKIMCQLALPISLGGMLVGPQMLPGVLGSAFSASAPAFQILSWSLLFNFQNYLLFYTLAALNQQKLTALSTGIGLGLNIGLNLWLLPRWGYLGAASSTLLTEIVVWLLNLWFYHHLLGLRFPSSLVKTILALGMMGGIVGLGLELQLYWGLMVPLGALIYGLCLWLLGAIAPEDWALIRPTKIPTPE